MKALSKKATQIFLSIISQVDESGYVKIDNDETYMSLIVEKIFIGKEYEKISFAHYGKENGDLMADPEMVFLYYPASKKIFPYYYKQDYINIVQISIIFENEKPSTYYADLQIDHANFADQWLTNIQLQQHIKIEESKE